MAYHPTDLAKSFQQFLAEEEIDEIARGSGFLVRKRKCTPLRLVLALVLGLASEAERTLAGLRRFFTRMTGLNITSAAFQKRFSDRAAAMFARLLERLLEKSAELEDKVLPTRFRRFRDIVAVDSTAFSLKDRLAKHFRGFKSLGTKAVARITTTMGLASHQVLEPTITSGRKSETKSFRIGRHLAGHLVVLDLGFFSFARFRALVGAGADFISRLKEGVNPVVLAVHMGKTRLKDPAGRRLRTLRFSGQFIDLDVVLGRGKNGLRARVVGDWNPETKEYHWYVTSVAREILGPRDVAESYRFRWQVELLYKEWRSLLRLDQIPTGKPHTARCLMIASMIAHVLTRILARLLMKKKRPWQYSPRKWCQYVLHFAAEIAKAINDADLDTLTEALLRLKRTAPGEVMRASTAAKAPYAVRLS